ncbi:SPW repeat protein [Streptomyces sp. NPDC002838]|uniref:SPW repeat domain-containing protein n=1 Tax=Streptomyces sp. NPDC002838 TaxID=3154436 RepID=UPI003332E87E
MARKRELTREVRNSLISAMMPAAGVWLFIGAWIIGYPFNEPAVDAHLNEMIVGVVVFLVAVARMVRQRGPVSDLAVAAGAWLIAAPFVVSYGDTRKQMRRGSTT